MKNQTHKASFGGGKYPGTNPLPPSISSSSGQWPNYDANGDKFYMKILRFPLKIASIYNGWNLNYPFTTMILSNGFILGMGDFLIQRLDAHLDRQMLKRGEQVEIKSHDWKRTFIQAIYGSCIAGPIFSIWLSKILPRLAHMPAHAGLKHISKKVIIDQCIMSWFGGSLYLYSISRLNMMNHKDSYEKLQANFMEIFRNHFKLWPAVAMVGFYFIPIRFQLVFFSFFAMCWSGFMSYVFHKKPQTQLIKNEIQQ